MDIENIFTELRAEFKKYDSGMIENKKKITPDFNAFEILYALELPLSRMIGEFLNPKGTHEQGRIFLDLFTDMFLNNHPYLKKFTTIELKLEHEMKCYRVGDSQNLFFDLENFNGSLIERGYIDIKIDFDNKFGIAFENKPFAIDGYKQIESYCDYMKFIYGDSNFIMIYLSSSGSEPSETSLSYVYKDSLGNRFVVVSYPQIRKWFLECAIVTENVQAERLTNIILEFAEYINRIFCGTNSLKDNMIGDTIKKNILEAFEIHSLWNANKTDYEKIWTSTINNLFNIELPKLIFEKLKADKIIDENWEYISGNFDINIRSLKGFKFRKKNWNQFKIGVISTAFGKSNVKRSFFPIIISDKKIEPANIELTKNYNSETSSEPNSNWIGYSGKVFWSANFPDNNYYIWDYEQWSEIKPGGKTVEYVGNFLGKLIKACETDIDTIENNLLHPKVYNEDKMRNFINQFEWTFAKTYADKAPHEYIVLDKVGLNHKEEFIEIAQFIRDKGFKAMYYTREGYYYKIEENYYWTMDEKVEDTNLINRAKWSDYELIDNSWFWKGRK